MHTTHFVLSLLLRAGDVHLGGLILPGWRPSKLISLSRIFSCMKPEKWLRIYLSRNWCLCIAICSRSGACSYCTGTLGNFSKIVHHHWLSVLYVSAVLSTCRTWLFRVMWWTSLKKNWANCRSSIHILPSSSTIWSACLINLHNSCNYSNSFKRLLTAATPKCSIAKLAIDT